MDGPAAGFNAIGLAGVLTGDSDGHAVRALLELIDVNGELRLVALGRRIDGGNSQTFAADEDWRTLLPKDQWVHLTATFDFDAGHDGALPQRQAGGRLLHPHRRPVAGDRPGTARHHRHRSARHQDRRQLPLQGARDRNPCDCRMDALMFLDRSLSAREVANQYRYMTRLG